MKFQVAGAYIEPTNIPDELVSEISREAFVPGDAGTRCLLDMESVKSVARLLRDELVSKRFLESESLALQAIAFDKTEMTNWKVTWHQDLMFPIGKMNLDSRFGNRCVKDGIDFARPHRELLEELTAVRFHIDDCDESNGPLRVIEGSHTIGIIPSDKIAEKVSCSAETVCKCARKSVLLMKPLLLHASSKATEPRHRRVVHLVYAPKRYGIELWHRAI